MQKATNTPEPKSTEKSAALAMQDGQISWKVTMTPSPAMVWHQPICQPSKSAMHPFLIKINLAAQTTDSLEAICQWFGELDLAERRLAASYLADACQQAHPVRDEVDVAIAVSKLKPTLTPCTMLSKAQFPDRVAHRLAGLPDYELTRAFRLLFSLFSIADKRRRETQCRGSCTHEWHNLGSI